jgi:hypothetical protein
MASASTADFEKLGVFYLGRRFDPAAGAATAEPYLYDSKDLTTHAVCAGMTGSGKTGLCVSLLEEAAIDGIPAIAIDPKGDVGNLLLTFPELAARDFEPWVDPAEARRRGQDVATHAAEVATTWREGLAQWGQDGGRIARLRAAADFAIYTPGSTAGLPLRLLRSFAPPPPELIADREALAERIEGTVGGLVALLGVDAEPLRPEPILLAKILEHAWSAGRGLDLPSLIRAVQTPPFDTVGVFDLETFLPAQRRLELAMRCNHLLASPSFAAWLEGEPLEIGRLLHGADGRPRLSILSIAHLSESERMFFVTTLLNELVGWVRSQSGTSSLRALLYMDEIFGYFPPTAAPPSKKPMLTLLKQARACGLGVVLATQNPADLDYKGLANTGTWFLGRLQTERDKMRVLAGLEGAAAATGAAFEASRMEQVLAGLPGRVFLAHNVHEDAPLLFQTRWAMSYLRGPLTRDQIQRLMAHRKVAAADAAPGAAPDGESLRPASAGAGESAVGAAAARSSVAGAGTTEIALPGATAGSSPPAASGASAASGVGPAAATAASAPSAVARPLVPPEIEERFLALARPAGAGARLVYRPRLLARGRLHFVKAPAGIDHWEERQLIAAPPVEGATLVWESAPLGAGARQAGAVAGPALEAAPREPADFQPLPAAALNARRWAGWRKQLAADLYRDQRLVLWRCAALDAQSSPAETEGDFRARAAHLARERRDREVEALRRRYAPRVAALEEKVRRSDEKVKHEESQLGRERFDAVISIGTTLAGALLGRKLASVANVTRARSTLRGAGRASREKDDVARAGRNVEVAREDLARLESDLARDVAALERSLDPAALVLERLELAPRKTDVGVESLGLLWTPWSVDASGVAEPLYDAGPSR